MTLQLKIADPDPSNFLMLYNDQGSSADCNVQFWHPLPREGTATAETTGPTGVEMEALTAVQVALLTIYDMCKAADRGMTITGVRLLEKRGGKSGHFVAARA